MEVSSRWWWIPLTLFFFVSSRSRHGHRLGASCLALILVSSRRLLIRERPIWLYILLLVDRLQQWRNRHQSVSHAPGGEWVVDWRFCGTWRYQEYFDHPDALLQGGINAALSAGCFVGALCSGWPADRYSRKFTLIAASALFIVGSILQSAANGVPMLCAGRVVNGNNRL